MVVVREIPTNWCLIVGWCRRRSLTDAVAQGNHSVSCAPGRSCSGGLGWQHLASADIEVTQMGQSYQPLTGSKYYNRFNIRGARVSGGRPLRSAFALPEHRAWRVQPAGQKSVNAVLTHGGAVLLVDGLVSIVGDDQWQVLGTMVPLDLLVPGSLTRKVSLPQGYSQLVLTPIANLRQLLGLVPVAGATNGDHHVVDPGQTPLHSTPPQAAHPKPTPLEAHPTTPQPNPPPPQPTPTPNEA